MKKRGRWSGEVGALLLSRWLRADQALILLVAAVVLAVAVGGVASAATDQAASDPSALPTTQDMIQAIESRGLSATSPDTTDPSVAEDMPHRDLGRAEAVELFEGVFGNQLESPASIFDELEVEKFLAPNVAVVPAAGQSSSSPPEAEEEVPTEGAADAEPTPPEAASPAIDASGKGRSPVESAESDSGKVKADEIHEQVPGATLMTSTLPLRVEGPSGRPEPVDLGLEHTEGELQPAAPLVEVGVPEELGEGIQLPGPGVGIVLAEAPEGRTPSTVDNSVAVYPNVARDTDLAVAPTPTGVETLTQIRSAEAPQAETFELHLPSGASLEATDEGGAVVTHGSETLVSVAAPTALDAAGEAVSVELSVSGASLTLTASPTGSTTYPIILDPLFQVYEWSRMTSWPATGEDGICNDSFELRGSNVCNNREEWGEEHVDNPGSPQHIFLAGQIEPSPGLRSAGLFIASSGTAEAGNRGTFLYTVPRYFTDQEHKLGLPTSFIAHLTLSDLTWKAYSSGFSPYLLAGIWDPLAQNWVSGYYAQDGLSGHGLNNPTFPFPFENATNPDTNAKVAEVNVVATETHANSNAQVEVGDATVELGDIKAPKPPAETLVGHWVNQAPTNITVIDEDTGLGMSAITASTEQLGANGQPLHSWKASYGCLGVADAACPRVWNTSESGHPHLTVEPALLPTGIDNLNLVGEDVVGNRSEAALAEVDVDHTAPAVALSGTVTEMGRLGKRRGSYTLKVNATDGSASAPQSGVTKVVIEFDGQVVQKEERSCASENCSIAPEWTIESDNYTAGRHTIKVTATDAAGNTGTPTELSIVLNPAPPTLSLSGTMTEQASLGTARPRYKLALSASSVAGVQRPSVESLSSFGSYGSGEGQFIFPADVARDSRGDLWVADWGNDRIKEFGEAGEYLGQFGGGEGSGNGQFEGPTAVAIDAKGDFWVTDQLNHRIEEFNEKGEYVRQFGSKGTGHGQFAGEGPEGLAVAAGGNIWISDTYGSRIEEFNEKGEFLKVLGSQGSGPGQFSQPTGIDIASSGNIYVADWVNDRIEEFNEKGEYVRQFGSQGSGNGQFQHPGALAVDARGDVWVGDAWDGRVEEFNEAGEYITQFGSSGWGEGQFGYGHAAGMALDAQGDIWVPDTEDDRIERWRIPGFAPAFQRAFGGQESGPGRLASPRGISAPGWGAQFWVADTGHDRIQCFNYKGEFVRETGSPGSGAGQFDAPGAVATDSEGDAWVVDTGNDRIQEFNHEGRFVRRIGSLGSGAAQFNAPTGVAIDEKGHVWVADSGNARVEEFGREGEFIRQFGSTGTAPGQFRSPGGVATDSKGDVWVADSGNARVQEFGPEGAFLRQSGSEGGGEGQFRSPQSIAVGPEGDIWVADTGNDRIEGLNPEGIYIAQFGSGGDNEGQFSEPTGIAVDPNGDIWVADTRNDRVEEMGGGEFVRQLGGEGAGAGRLSSPRSVAGDAAGDVWVIDTGNDRVQEFGPAGNFIRQFGSYGTGPGQFRSPGGIALDREGHVWVADKSNNRLEEFTPSGGFIRQFGSTGTAAGQFRSPASVAAGPAGEIWVADEKTIASRSSARRANSSASSAATGPERASSTGLRASPSAPKATSGSPTPATPASRSSAPKANSSASPVPRAKAKASSSRSKASRWARKEKSGSPTQAATAFRS